MAVSISMNIRQNSQSIENNTSNVTVEVYAWWTNGSYNAQTAPDGYPQARGTVTIDDVAYAFYSKFNTDHTTSGYGLIFTKTLDISHNNEGEKVLSCWASYATGVSSGTVSTSGSLALPTIPRKSVLKPNDGVLGAELILKVERKSSLLTHTLTYQCGAESGVICEKTGNTDIAWTPPISLAAQYPSTTSVPIVFTVTTYHGDKEIGSAAVTLTYAIPESVKPAVSLEVSDMMGYFSKYGAYVQKKSRLHIAVAASGNQGARITAYKIEADGMTYTNATVITDQVSGSGDLTVKATVTDTRGRTETANVVIPVMTYTAPNVSAVSVDRTDEKGNVNSSGGYLTVHFHAAVTALNGKNSAVYTLQYKKANEEYFFSHTLTEYTGRHTVNNGVVTFAAETASSYNILVLASDDFESGSKTGVGSSIKKTWSMLKNGVGFAFGKIAEKANTLDMGWDIELNENDVLRNGSVAYAPNGYGLGKNTGGSLVTDFNDAKLNGWYCNSGGSANAPWAHGGMIFVNAYNDTLLRQTAYAEYNNGMTAERWMINGVWQPWYDISHSAFAPAGNYAPGGYGLGKNAGGSWVDDFNSAVTNGWFNNSGGSANAPWAHGGMIFVNAYNENLVRQIAYTEYYNWTAVRWKIDGVWQPWDHVNPPMLPGVEYRTTERWNGKAVYRKAISFTPSGTLAGSFTVPHDISNFDSIIDCAMNCNKTLTPPYTEGYWTTVEEVDATQISVFNTNPEFNQNDKFYFELAYTKTA